MTLKVLILMLCNQTTEIDYSPWPRPAAGPPMAPDAAAPKAPVEVVDNHTKCLELTFVVITSQMPALKSAPQTA